MFRKNELNSCLRLYFSSLHNLEAWYYKPSDLAENLIYDSRLQRYEG